MKRWGLIVTAFYVVVVAVCLLVRASLKVPWDLDVSEGLGLLVWASVIVGGELLLLLLTVDTTDRRLRPRQALWVSVVTAALLIALLLHSAALALVAGIYGEQTPEIFFGWAMAGVLVALWAAWAVVFYLYAKGTPIATTRIVGWLLKGSVLNLLIAVPSHIIVRRRDDCSAPFLTGYGLATGLAIMLLSFGPGVWFLYRQRIERGDMRRR